jgi:hypothetical protein
MELREEASFLLLKNVRSRFALPIINIDESRGSRWIFQSCQDFRSGKQHFWSIVFLECLVQPVYDSGRFQIRQCVNGSESHLNVLISKKFFEPCNDGFIASNHAGGSDCLDSHCEIIGLETLGQDGSRPRVVPRERRVICLWRTTWRCRKHAARYK